MIWKKAKSEALIAVYERMIAHFGPRNWWPGETPDEIIIGAILVQNVAWRNVEQAIDHLRAAGLLSLEAIHRAPVEILEPLIIPTRYYKQKARKLKAFAAFLCERYGTLERMFEQGVESLRPQLLALKGIGPETADCILLYAGGLPSFTCDAYTRRIFSRLGFFGPNASYEEMRRFFMEHLPPEAALFNEFHAQIDGIGHFFCAPQPRCEACPLRPLCRQHL